MKSGKYGVPIQCLTTTTAATISYTYTNTSVSAVIAVTTTSTTAHPLLSYQGKHSKPHLLLQNHFSNIGADTTSPCCLRSVSAAVSRTDVF